MQTKTEIEYTPEQVESRTSDYICDDCGRYFKPIPSDTVLTYHFSECGLCHTRSGVTHMRAFNYLQQPKQTK